MLFTEDEAAHNWCPHARIMETDSELTFGASANRRGSGVPLSSCRCLGRQCMAWRWTELKRPREAPATGFDIMGYCGLAGRP